MKAAYIEAVGPADQIRYGELPEPQVGPSDVLVRVAAVAVDPVDTYIRSGKLPIELPRPFIIGRDMVGQVQRVGSAVETICPRRPGLVQQPGLRRPARDVCRAPGDRPAVSLPAAGRRRRAPDGGVCPFGPDGARGAGAGTIGRRRIDLRARRGRECRLGGARIRQGTRGHNLRHRRRCRSSGLVPIAGSRWRGELQNRRRRRPGGSDRACTGSTSFGTRRDTSISIRPSGSWRAAAGSS